MIQCEPFFLYIYLYSWDIHPILHWQSYWHIEWAVPAHQFLMGHWTHGIVLTWKVSVTSLLSKNLKNLCVLVQTGFGINGPFVVSLSSMFSGMRGGMFMCSLSRLNKRIRHMLFQNLMKQEISFFEENKPGTFPFTSVGLFHFIYFINAWFRCHCEQFNHV